MHHYTPAEVEKVDAPMPPIGSSEHFLAVVVALAGTIGLAYSSAAMMPGTPGFANPADHHKYIYMAAHGCQFHIAPFCWRVGVPTLAGLWPGGITEGFYALTLAGVFACALLIYYLARSFGQRAELATVGMLFFFSLPAGAAFVLHDFWLPDAAAWAFIIAAMLAAKLQRPWLMAGILAVGVSVKESVLFAAPLYYTLSAGWSWNRRQIQTTILVTLPALFILFAIRKVISAPDYTYCDLFQTVGLVRLRTFSLCDFKSYTGWTFGLPLLVTPWLAPVRMFRLLAQFMPFLLCVYAQLLFAKDTQRLLVIASPAIILMALTGLEHAIAHMQGVTK